jgi:outer membrane lipoprotein LolB
VSWAARGSELLAAPIAAIVLAACASIPQGATPVGGETLAGRLAVKVDASEGVAARSETAAFELQGSAEAGRLNLATPLGSVIAQARWGAGTVALVTPQGERRFADLDALTQEVLGESVPVTALFDWLRGRPWPGATSQVITTPPGFAQLGWAVDLTRLSEGWVTARRERAPSVTVRAKLEAS